MEPYNLADTILETYEQYRDEPRHKVLADANLKANEDNPVALAIALLVISLKKQS